MGIVTEEVGVPGVAFLLILAPLEGCTGLSVRDLEARGGLLGGIMRSVLAAELLSSGGVPDQALIAGAFDAVSGAGAAYNESSSVNVAGNVLGESGGIVGALSRGSVAASGARRAAAGILTTNAASGGSLRRGGSDSSGPRRRSLDALFLQPFNATALLTAADEEVPSRSLLLTLNIVFFSQLDAASVAAELRAGYNSDALSSALAALLAAISNATGASNLTASLPPSSVALVQLVLRRSFWARLWDLAKLYAPTIAGAFGAGGALCCALYARARLLQRRRGKGGEAALLKAAAARNKLGALHAQGAAWSRRDRLRRARGQLAPALRSRAGARFRAELLAAEQAAAREAAAATARAAEKRARAERATLAGNAAGNRGGRPGSNFTNANMLRLRGLRMAPAAAAAPAPAATAPAPVSVLGAGWAASAARVFAEEHAATEAAAAVEEAAAAAAAEEAVRAASAAAAAATAAAAAEAARRAEQEEAAQAAAAAAAAALEERAAASRASARAQQLQAEREARALKEEEARLRWDAEREERELRSLIAAKAAEAAAEESAREAAAMAAARAREAEERAWGAFVAGPTRSPPSPLPSRLPRLLGPAALSGNRGTLDAGGPHSDGPYASPLLQRQIKLPSGELHNTSRHLMPAPDHPEHSQVIRSQLAVPRFQWRSPSSSPEAGWGSGGGEGGGGSPFGDSGGRNA